MIRAGAGVVAGLIAWFVVATLANLLMRIAWPDYAAVESAMTFTGAMMGARLAIGALASLAAGSVAAWVAKGRPIAVGILIMLIVGLFVPVHYGLWDKFPLWYHALFFVSLIALTLIGARAFGARSEATLKV